MSATSVILQGRVLLESMMTTTVIGRRADGTFTTDPVTLVESPNYSITVYEGPARFRMPGATTPGTEPIPGAVVTDDESIMSLPVAASADVRIDDVFEVTANPLDGGLVGVKFRVSGTHHQTYATARRFPVVETN